MAEVEQQQEPTPPAPLIKQRRIFRSVILTLLLTLILLVISLAVMFSTDKGSKFLLDQVLQRQQIIQYEYEGGNLWKGIILKNVVVTLKPVDVKIDRADVSLGWRAILDKEIHLREADVRNLRIITKGEPSDEPFKFSEIKLPFVLRLDTADVDHLNIRTASDAQVDFYDVHLNNALWSGTELEFEDSRMDMGYLAVRKATGKMKFSGKYPLEATAIANLPALRDSLNVHDIAEIGRAHV